MTAGQHHQDEDQGGAEDHRVQPDPRWPRLLWKITVADPEPGSGGGPGDVDGTGPEADPPGLVVRRPTPAEAEAWAARHRDRLLDAPPVHRAEERP